MAYPQPTQVAPWYLRNITQALELDEATGNVFVRTNAALIGNVSVGNVSIGALGNVDLTGNTLPVTVESGNVTVYQGTDPWNVTGNVNVDAITGNIAGITGNIAGITGNVTIVDGGGSITIDGNVGITGTVNANITGGNVTSTLDGTNLDAFGRLRVSNPVTLFDTNNLYLSGGQFANLNATGGTYTYVPAESSFNMAVTAANGSSVIAQARYTQAYQPGKSLLNINSFCFGTLKANCRQRVGYFTATNGIYFEADGEDLYLVIRSSASGSLVEERIAQTSWNTNTMKTGASPNPSGYNLNPALTNIFWCDIEWLGVGNVRAGFIVNGQFIVCHTFQHANQAGNTKVYMTSAVCNPRYEITNTGATTGSTTMKQICASVISEGGYTPTPLYNYISNDTNVTRISAANTVTALCAVRVNPAYPDAVVKPAQIDLLTTDVRYGQLKLVVNPSINVASWSNVANSCMQTAIISNTISDGTVVFAQTASSRSDIAITDGPGLAGIQLGRDVNGNTDVLVYAVAWTQNNTDVLWKLAWNEFTNN
jgi:hypothetical protein